MWSKLEIKKVLNRMTDIYEKGDSFMKDLDLSKQRGLQLSGFLSGITLTLTLTLVFLVLLYILPLGNTQLVIPFLVVVAVFLMYDVAKGELLEGPQEEGNMTQVYDVMNTYMIENSSTKMSPDSKVPKSVFTLLMRAISPLIYYNIPKIYLQNIDGLQ